ncbi:MAG TPA: VOC family protein [Methylocystis sp.]|nr:VOC family protein [Methylocystis sp.]
MPKLVPTLWFSEKAEEAATFYASLLPDSHVDSVVALPADSPSGPAGSVKIVAFTLMGRPFLAFNGGLFEPFNHAISLTVECDDQQEIDRLWAALSEGGQNERCGWLKDRYGVSWQIVPSALSAMMAGADPVRAKRAAEAMLKMTKLDIAALQRAYEGREA